MTVLEAVREVYPAKMTYDDDVRAYVAERLAVEETRDLGREVYAAKGIVNDERRTARIMGLLDEGFVPVEDVELVEGARFMLLGGTVYCGAAVAEYPREAKPVRVAIFDGRPVFVEKGRRAYGFHPSSPMLVRPGWSS